MYTPTAPTAPSGYHQLKKTLHEDLYVADHARRTATGYLKEGTPICASHVAHFFHDESEVTA